MAKHATRKDSPDSKRETLTRKASRSLKYRAAPPLIDTARAINVREVVA